MLWQIVYVPDKPPSSSELSTVDVLASVIEPKLANTLVRKLNQICPLQNLLHVKRVRKRSVEGKVELSVILCLNHEHENLFVGMPNDVLQLASTYQLSPYKAKVAKYAALSKEEWEEQCKLWPTSYHPSTHSRELTSFDEEESQLIINYMKFAMSLMRTPNGEVVNAAVIVDPLSGKIIATGIDQTFVRLPTNETISNCVNVSGQSAATLSFQPGGNSLGNIPDISKMLPTDVSRVSCFHLWQWTEARPNNPKEKCQGNFSWHPLRHATLVSIENAAARDRKLFPCLESQKNHPLQNGGVNDCSDNPTKRLKIQLSENLGVIAVDAFSESLPSEGLKPYLCTGFDIYIVWEPCAIYKIAYEGAISTLPGKELWDVISDGVVIGVPNSLRPRGRPKKRRIPSFLEGTKKSKKYHKCSRCGESGHHRSTCKNPLNLRTEVDPNLELQSTVKLPIRREII